MTYLLEEHTGADSMLVTGGMSGLETYDELAREREARAKAESTAAHLAELIAAEHLHVAEARREIAELRVLVDAERTRADQAERELGKLIVNDYSDTPQPSVLERWRHERRWKRARRG